MKAQYQQLRNILDAVVYPVDPAHEAAFRAILLNDKKRRRKNLLLFWASFVVLLAAGYLAATALIQQKKEVPVEIKPTDPTASVITTNKNSLLSAESEMTASPTVEKSIEKDAEMKMGSDNSDHSQGTATHANANTTTQIAQNKGQVAQANISSKRSQKRQPEITSADQNKTSGAPLVAVQQGSLKGNDREQKTWSPPSSVVTNPPKEASDAWVEHHEKAGETIAIEKMQAGSSTDALQSTFPELSYTADPVSDDEHIIPALRKIQSKKMHYGVTGSLFPAGQLFTRSSVRTGYGFTVGAYTTYKVTPRTQLRADAGFSHLDGGFSYIKHSESEQYGFFALHQTNRLAIERLYAGYLSAEVGLQRGKKRFCAGMLGQYLYGARGDIEVVQHTSIEQSPVITVSEDIWLETEDMQRLSLHASAGVRSRMTRRLELALFLRIPLTHTLKKQADNSAYQFDIQSHGITPHFTLSYQINQQ